MSNVGLAGGNPSIGILATSTSNASSSSHSTSQARIEWRERAALKQAFSETPDLEALVCDAARELGRAFAGQARIAVEALIDPEEQGARAQVFVIAVTSLPFEQADELLDTVLDDWWSRNQSRADYRVSLATELL